MSWSSVRFLLHKQRFLKQTCQCARAVIYAPSYSADYSNAAAYSTASYSTTASTHSNEAINKVVFPINQEAETAQPIALRSRKAKSTLKHTVKAFVDWKAVRVRGGDGGEGCISLARVYCNAQAGPDGGDGGNGGHVIFKATGSCKSLQHLTTVLQGEAGDGGAKRDCNGKNAEHRIVPVPIGTMIKLADETLAADLSEEGMMFIASRGGAGGRGNHFFASDINQTPRYAEMGGEGEITSYILEMRCIADVGLIGFPNAGKSTFLRSVSRARPKVASYPFTTLQPHIGVITFNDYSQLRVADIPGLIPDAHKNRGLGIDFLRHIQRCSCLLYILDLSSPSPWLQLETLMYELEMFSAGLSSRPHAVIANKIDLPQAKDNLCSLRDHTELPMYAISAKHGTAVSDVVRKMRELSDYHKQQQMAPQAGTQSDRVVNHEEQL